MSFNYYLQTNFLPKIKSTLKAIVKPPAMLEINAKDFIGLWGPGKISSFVSIGANDGVKNDPLADYIERYNWKGIMVEPMPSNFEKLKKNVGHIKSIILENVGITDQPGNFDFYHLKDIRDDEPDWYDQVSSFDKDSFYRNISVTPSLFDRVAVAKVDAITFDMLMSKHSLQSIDLLMIDTEGYDYKILSSIDIKKYKPQLIVFEYEWLTNYDFKAAIVFLKNAGYRIILNGFDCIAIK